MPPDDALPPELEDAVARLDALVQAFERHPDPQVQEAVVELLRCVDLVHRAGITTLMAILAGAGLADTARAAPEVGLLYTLYDVQEDGGRQRAEAALAGVLPYITSHGGALEVVSVERGVVHVRLSGACQGCQGSAATLRHVVEAALRDGLPDFVKLEAEDEPPAPANFVPLAAVAPRKRLHWHSVLAMAELPPGMVRGTEIEGTHVLLANLDGEVYAYTDACPGTPLPLHGGRVEGETLVCPWHGCRFDLRGGKRLGEEAAPGLGVLPVAVEHAEIRLGVLR